MLIIDAHCHLHKPQWIANKSDNIEVTHYNKDYPEDVILENMLAAGIEKTVVFPLPTIHADLATANHYVSELPCQYPGRFVPFTIIDHQPEYWIGKGIQGFKEHTYGQRIQKNAAGQDFFSQEFKDTYRCMEEYHVPLLLHAGVNRIERLKYDIFRDTPGLIVILAHLGADFPENNRHRPHIDQVRTTLTELKNYPNLFFDISAIPDPEIIREALLIVGCSRLIFGSDFPHEKPSVTLQRLLSLKNIKEGDLEKILYYNITGILGKKEKLIMKP